VRQLIAAGADEQDQARRVVGGEQVVELRRTEQVGAAAGESCKVAMRAIVGSPCSRDDRPAPHHPSGAGRSPFSGRHLIAHGDDLSVRPHTPAGLNTAAPFDECRPGRDQFASVVGSRDELIQCSGRARHVDRRRVDEHLVRRRASA
jgi:hypothetical protein